MGVLTSKSDENKARRRRRAEERRWAAMAGPVTVTRREAPATHTDAAPAHRTA